MESTSGTTAADCCYGGFLDSYLSPAESDRSYFDSYFDSPRKLSATSWSYHSKNSSLSSTKTSSSSRDYQHTASVSHTKTYTPKRLSSFITQDGPRKLERLDHSDQLERIESIESWLNYRIGDVNVEYDGYLPPLTGDLADPIGPQLVLTGGQELPSRFPQSSRVRITSSHIVFHLCLECGLHLGPFLQGQQDLADDSYSIIVACL